MDYLFLQKQKSWNEHDVKLAACTNDDMPITSDR
jgi:hypothetical protein